MRGDLKFKYPKCSSGPRLCVKCQCKCCFITFLQYSKGVALCFFTLGWFLRLGVSSLSERYKIWYRLPPESCQEVDQNFWVTKVSQVFLRPVLNGEEEKMPPNLHTCSFFQTWVFMNRVTRQDCRHLVNSSTAFQEVSQF